MSMQAERIFINLPVKDLQNSIHFFSELGFEFNPQFTDENATCMIISETIFAMLLTEPFFQTFTKKEITDTSRNIEAITALQVNSRDKVDEIISSAVRAGGTSPQAPAEQGFMYGASFEDLDGHLWEVMYIDESAADPEG